MPCPRPAQLLPVLLAAATLTGCGSAATKTVTAQGEPPTTSTATTTATATHTTTTAPTQSTTQPAPSTATSTTHTSPEPAFAEGGSQGEGASAATALVRSMGYTPQDPAQYHENQTLRVLIGDATGASGERAFFFVDGRFIGTDTKLPSGAITLVSQSDTEVALAYGLYRKGDPLSSPSGGHAVVRFQLNDGKLQPVGAIPPVSASAGLSRN